MWLEGGLDIICDNSTTIVQVKVFTETAVGAHHRETHFKAIDFARKGDGQFSNINKKERISNPDFTYTLAIIRDRRSDTRHLGSCLGG